RSGAIILTGPSLELHESLKRRVAVMQLPEPGPAEFRQLLDHIARDIGRTSAVTVQLTDADEQRLLRALRGLTLLEAEKVLTKATTEGSRPAAYDIVHVIDAKKQMVALEGVLEYYPAEDSLAEVADLAGLKDWLRKRKNILSAPARAAEFGLTFPRGVLLIGVP